MTVLDHYSLLLLAELQRDSRQTVAQLSKRTGLSSTPCWKRVKDMEARGIIRDYTVNIDREKVGLQLCVIAQVNLTQHNEALVLSFEEAVARTPAIINCYSTTGPADYIMTVLATDIKAYEQFLRDTLLKLPCVTHVRSSVVLKEHKSGGPLPIASARDRRRAPVE